MASEPRQLALRQPPGVLIIVKATPITPGRIFHSVQNLNQNFAEHAISPTLIERFPDVMQKHDNEVLLLKAPAEDNSRLSDQSAPSPAAGIGNGDQRSPIAAWRPRNCVGISGSRLRIMRFAQAKIWP